MTIKNIIIINDFDYVQGGASKVAIQSANLIKEFYPQLNVYFFSGAHNDSSILNKDVISICTNQGEALNNKNKIQGMINGLYNHFAKKELLKLLKTLDNKETIIHVHGWTKSLSSSVFDVAFKNKFEIVVTLHDYFTVCPNGGFFNYKSNRICNLNPMSVRCIKSNCDSRNYFFKLYRVCRQLIQNKIVKLHKHLKNIVVISDFSKSVLKKHLNKNVNLYKINNPIDIDFVIEKDSNFEHNYYLYVGRISKEKGVDLFCEAISKLGKKGIVVGDGSQKKELEEKYKNIAFVGWKGSSEVKQYMINANALVIPSRWYEGAPLTPLEAMQYHIPFFSSNCNASVDYYVSGKEDFIFELNAESLMDKIEKYERMKRFDFSSYFDITLLSKKREDYVNSLLSLYDSLIEGVIK